jgi:hypothetical protein
LPTFESASTKVISYFASRSARDIRLNLSGKKVRRVAGIAAMQQRIAQLVAEKTRLLDRIAADSSAALMEKLAEINKDLATAQTRLAHYRAQQGRHN